MSEKTAPDETGPLLLPRQDGAAASGERRSRLSFLTTILAQLAALSLLANFWWDWTHPGATSVVVDADGADKWSWSDVGGPSVQMQKCRGC